MENMNIIPDGPPPPPPLTELIASLEQAAFMAKQLPTTSDQTHLLQIYSSFQQTRHLLSSFLPPISQFPPPPPPPPPPETLLTASNSLSSAIGSEPMQLGDDGDDLQLEGAEENSFSKSTNIDMVEERMRDCFIKNKRPKRPLSPYSAAAAEERRVYDDGISPGFRDFDPLERKLSALDLVFQFHA